jgi:AbrB family looped-hinge helix DNA binding protein
VGVRDRLTTVIKTKGQVILPKAIRDQLQWGAGPRLTVKNTPDGVLLKSTPVFAASSIDALFGTMRHEGPALSIDDMNAAITREAERRAGD